MTRGTIRPVQRKTLNYHASIHNRFDIEVRDAKTQKLKRKAQAFNVICDTLWDQLLYTSGGAWCPASYFKYILFGSGSGTPSTSDTALFSQLGYRSAPSAIAMFTVTPDRVNGVFSMQAVGTLNAEDNVGDTITEVGIGYDNSHCVTHAMLQDMNGNPISITKTATDVILIYATIYVHWNPGGWGGGSINVAAPVIASNAQTFLATLAGMSGGSSGMTARFASVDVRTGQSSNDSQYNGSTYFTPVVNRANKTISYTMRLAADETNRAIRGMCFEFRMRSGSSYTSSRGLWITPGSWFTPSVISAEAIGTGDGTTTGFDTAFPVKTIGTVYVDGVAASGATMRVGPHDTEELVRYFNRLDAEVVTSAGTPIYASEANIYTGTINSATHWAIRHSGDVWVYENPFYSVGVDSFYVVGVQGSSARTVTIEASDDGTTWSAVGNTTTTPATISVPSALQHKRFFRFTHTGTDVYIRAIGLAAPHNIEFSTPPAAGAVITADYTPDCVAKDENHVFDLAVTFAFGEYQEE